MKYPVEAYSPSGVLWWQLAVWPGKKRRRFGVEPRLAAWLNFNTKAGQVFTMRDLRQVLGDDGGANTHEHFGRRFRRLREYGWVVHSSRDVADLGQDEYLLEERGAPIWLGKAGHGNKRVSAKIRREVFDRDGNRCVVCGIGSGEPYPDEVNKRARLTIGHFVADSFRGASDLANLRTECSRCNEPVKEEARRSESASEIWPKIRGLSRGDKQRLLSWIENGYRGRDTVDRLFDQVRTLPALQREDIRAQLARAVRPPTP